MAPKRLTCTITWNGIRTGTGDEFHRDVGARVNGTFTLVIPPYPGNGAAKVSNYKVFDVGNFQHKTICSEAK